MFKDGSNPDSNTRNKILTVALDLFREKGMDASTMREISKQAGVALGSAYYYFPSKEAIVAAYYEHVQDQHHAHVQAHVGDSPLLVERMKMLFHSKFDIIQRDRKLLGAIFRYAGEPQHPLSMLGEGTRQLQDRGLNTVRLVLKGQKLPADIEKLLVLGLWALQMAFIMHFLYDETEHQQATREMIDGSLELVSQLIGISAFPMMRPMIQPFLEQVLNLAEKSQAGPKVS